MKIVFQWININLQSCLTRIFHLKIVGLSQSKQSEKRKTQKQINKDNNPGMFCANTDHTQTKGSIKYEMRMETAKTTPQINDLIWLKEHI